MSQEIVTLHVNGFAIVARFSKKNLEELWMPLLKHVSELWQVSQKRIVIFVAAPPGVGKSTLAAYLELLSSTLDGIEPIQVLGLDGFHHKNAYLNQHAVMIEGEEVPMKDVKGCPETFDIVKFLSYLGKINQDHVKWPFYDRNQHDVMDEVIQVEKNIVLIEGNWLLLDEPAWRVCRDYADFTVFIEAEEEDLKERLIHRKVLGGRSNEEALEFYKRSDQKNIQRVLKNRLSSDMTLVLAEDGEFMKKEEKL